MAEPQQQQLDRRLSSRRHSRALSLGRWGASAGNSGGAGDAGTRAAASSTNANGDDGSAEPRTALPLLNEYAAAKASIVGSKISELTSFADLSPAIADARFVGPSAEKKARAALASTILPRLAMHEGLPASLVKPLLALWHKGRPGGGSSGSSSSAIVSIDSKTSRLAIAIAGLLLGPGEAGTPTPLPGAAPPSAAADAAASEAVRASLAEVPGLDSDVPAAVADPSPGLTEGALRLLAAAARGGSSSSSSSSGGSAGNSSTSSSPSSTKWDGDFVSALGVALARGEARAMAFVDANGEAGAAALAALAAAAAEAATKEGGANDSSSASSKILGALTSSSSSLAKRRAAAAAAVADSSDALHGALAAARASLKGRALRDAALRAAAGAASADPLCARHALALMAGVARSDPARAARAFGLLRSSSSSRKSSSVLSSFDLAAAASTALASYETSALVLGAAVRPSSAGGGSSAPASASASASAAASTSSSSMSAPPSPTPGLNLDDPLARVYAARLLSAMLFAGIGGGSAAAAVSYASERSSGGGAALLSLLAALATRDADDMVALEACKALAGWSGVGSNAFSCSSSLSVSSAASSSASSYSNNPPTTAVQDEASARDAAARARAFAVLCSRAGDATPTVFIPGLMSEEAATGLLGALCSRVRGALGSRNPPLVCAGARTAATLAEAAVRGYDAAVGGGSAKSSSRRAADATVAAVASLSASLAAVTSSSSPAEAELALEALLWMQAMPLTINPVVLDAGKVFSLAGCLSESLATAALAAARKVVAAVAPRALAASSSSSIRSVSSSSSNSAILPTVAFERTLLVATALVAGNPSRSRGEASLPELWANAARLGGWCGRAVAARAALAVLEAPCPVLLASHSSSDFADLASSVTDDVAWTGVQQSAAWWLGEHGNAASCEVVGGGGAAFDGGAAAAAMAATAADALSTTTSSGGSGVSLSSAPISASLSLASGRSQLLADIIAALQHACAATLPPHARPTAALALCKIAARSDEPYCGSAFSFLAAMLAGGPRGAGGEASSSSGPLGLAPFVADAVAALDEVYSSRIALQGLVKGRLVELATERKEREKAEEKKKGGDKKKGGGGANGVNGNNGSASDADGDENTSTALFDEATLAAVREQHNAVCARLQRLTGLLPDKAYPLGPLSRSLLENGGEELLQAAVKAADGERSSELAAAAAAAAAANDATTSEERVEAERAKLEALLLGGGRAISEVGSSDEEAEEVDARAGADGGGHGRRSSMAADDDDSDAADEDDDARGSGEFSTPPSQLFSSRSIGFSSTVDPLANLTRMLDEQILTGAAAGPTPFAFVKQQQQQQGGGLDAAAAVSASTAAAAEKDDDDDFSRDPLANYGSNDDLTSPYYGNDNDDALARATATPPPPQSGSELGVASQQLPLLLGIVEHAFDAALPEELSVVPGDRVRVRGEADGWLDCVLVVASASATGGRDGTSSSSGLVPESYVRYVGDVEFAEAGKKEMERLQAQQQPLSSSQLSPQGSLTPRADWLSKPDMLAALVSGGGASEEEAAGGQGSVVVVGGGGRVLERQTSANPFGRQGQVQSPPVSSSPAITPRALSRRQSDASGAAAAAAATSTVFSRSSYPARATFAFAAENDDELSVSEGEQVTVHASVDGWVQVENAAGKRGLVPESYVEKV